MSTSSQQIILSSVLKLLRPLVRILLRHGVPYGTFADLARWVYVDVAAKEFDIPNRKQSVSRISVITGLTRKDVVRIKSLPEPVDENSTGTYNRAARVITGWVRDHSQANGAIAPLPLEGSSPSFAELVKRYSGDMPTRAVLDELIRVGAVERHENDQLKLLVRAYLPPSDNPDKLAILGHDVGDLIAVIDHNLRINGPGQAYFQRKVAYDNLPTEYLPELRRASAERGQALLEHFDREMALYDRDQNPQVGGSGRKRAVVGIYYFEEDFR